MSPLMIGIYLMLCLLVAVAGRGTRVGPVGIFLLAVILTPLAVGVVLAVLRPSPKPKPTRITDGTTGNG
jgi:hypothetical protein